MEASFHPHLMLFWCFPCADGRIVELGGLPHTTNLTQQAQHLMLRGGQQLDLQAPFINIGQRDVSTVNMGLMEQQPFPFVFC